MYDGNATSSLSVQVFAGRGRKRDASGRRPFRNEHGNTINDRIIAMTNSTKYRSIVRARAIDQLQTVVAHRTSQQWKDIR